MLGMPRLRLLLQVYVICRDHAPFPPFRLYLLGRYEPRRAGYGSAGGDEGSRGKRDSHDILQSMTLDAESLIRKHLCLIMSSICWYRELLRIVSAISKTCSKGSTTENGRCLFRLLNQSPPDFISSHLNTSHGILSSSRYQYSAQRATLRSPAELTSRHTATDVNHISVHRRRENQGVLLFAGTVVCLM